MTKERISHFKRLRDSGAPCEAPEHVSGCSGLGTTIDHITPKCIAKILGWRKRKLNAPDNLQLLSEACHDAKDKDTAWRKQILIQGLPLRLGDVYVQKRS